LPRKVRLVSKARGQRHLGQRAHDAGSFGVEKGPGASERGSGEADGTPLPAAGAGGGEQAGRQVRDEAIHGQRLQRRCERPADSGRKSGARGHGVGHKGKGDRPLAHRARRLCHQSRLEVDDPVAKAFALDSCSPVMRARRAWNIAMAACVALSVVMILAW
jgi:hypothetical protein